MRSAIGVDLGGTKLHLAVVQESGEILAQTRVATPVELGGQSILDLLTEQIQALLEQYGNLPVGIGTPGLVAFPEGIILGCTPNLPGWEGRSLRTVLEERLGVPVIVDNDANVAAWGEYCLGSGKQSQHFVLLTLGTGLGSGVIVNGRLLRGNHGLGIGFGHMIVHAGGRMCNCGQQGCLEAYVSGNGLLKSYRLRGGDLALKGPAIFEQAFQGEVIAKETVAHFIEMLAVGCTNILNTLAPEHLVLGGGISSQGEKLLLKPVQDRIGAIMSMPLQNPDIISLAQLGSAAGVVGAALLALDMEIDVNDRRSTE
ncbi:MAG: ROK family protein [Candidatus Sericytochromatia bacterium]|nr:ROK family protein [Candidatus Sericytochromatia bacterium]